MRSCARADALGTGGPVRTLALWTGITLLVLLVAGCPGKTSGPCADFPPGPLDAGQSLALLEKCGDRLTLVDVRTDAEFNAGHAPGALHIPLAALGGRIRDVPRGPVLFLCRSGIRAAKAHALVADARPDQRAMWYLKGKPEYGRSGFTFH